MKENFESYGNYKNQIEVKTNSMVDDEKKHNNVNGKKIITADIPEVEELFAVEKKYKSIIDNIISVVYVVDKSGSITFISSSVKEFFGYEQNEVLGKNFLEFVAEDDIPIAKDNFEKIVIEKKSVHEFRLKSKNDGLKFVRFISAVVQNNSEFTGLMGIAIDISESKKPVKRLSFQSDILCSIYEAVISVDKDKLTDEAGAYVHNQELIENVLQEVEIGLRDIFEKSPIIFYTHTPENVINFINSKSKKLLGFDPTELKMRWTELLTDNPLNQKAMELTSLSIETGIPQEPFEIEMKNNKNETGWFEVHQIPVVKDGKTVLIVGSLTEITARKKAEGKLQASQSLLTNALELAKMGPWEYDVATDTFTFNDQLYKMFRTSVEEIGSYTMSSSEYAKRFVHPKSLQQLYSEIKSVVETTDPNYHREIEHHILYADGEEGIIAVRFNIIKDRNGKTIKTYGVNQDITKRKAAENEIVRAKEKAEEMSRLKSNFLANMSHELRTPMFGILGFTEILMSELTDPDQIQMALTIKNSGKRLIRTLNSILDLSRLEANKLDIKYSLINIDELIEETIEHYKPEVKKKDLYIIYGPPNKNIYLNTDRNILQIILDNLIDNAIKYTDSGGIIVKLFEVDSDSNEMIGIEVSDTGMGIPKELHKIIFEPFRQVSEGYSRNFEGSGLGLSISKKFVELLNGVMTLDSEPGIGSKFTIKFPSTNIKPKIDQLRESLLMKNDVTNITVKDKNILLVEDDSSNALTVCSYLKNYCIVDHVSDGQSAVKSCNQKKFDMILMDINLKGIDGVEIFRQIRKIDNHYAGVPVVAMTAYAMVGDREKFLNLGFTQYISKPFERLEFILLLTELFKKE